MIKEVLNYTGAVIKLFSVFFLLPIIVSFIYKENPMPFFIALVLSAVIGYFLNYKFKDYKDINLSKGFMITALSFVILSLLIAIPYLFLFKGICCNVIINSIFEAVSGITTSGLTVIDDLASVPKSLLFFRSLTQWVGGIGIVIVFLFIISQLRKSESKSVSGSSTSSSVSLYHATLSEDHGLDLRSLIRWVMKIYLIFTILGIVFLLLSGMNLFQASTMTFTSLSTGGFVVEDNFYSNNFQLGILIVLMLLGGISFYVHISLFKGKLKKVFSAVEPKILLSLIIIGVLLSMLFFTNLKEAIFQIVSAFTGTGFSIVDNSTLPHMMLFILFIAMIFGASMGSTCGGLKLIRVYTLLKSIPWAIKKLALPKSVIVPFKIKGRTIDENILVITYIFIASYFIILFLGTALFLALGYNFLDSSFQVVSALGTVGLSTMKISTIPIVGKIFLTVAMLLGRLEILPILVLIRNLFVRD